MKLPLSVVLATFNEEQNIAECLTSVKDIAEEIIIIDGSSSDKTVEIAKSFGAKVIVTTNPPIFHINKQKALDLATQEWVLQLDADERVTPELAKEITKVIQMNSEEIEEYENSLPDKKLFERHQKLLAERDGNIGDESKEYNAFFIPRLNYFLGKYLRYGGVYPDGVIRLVKKGQAYFPCKDVHEQIFVKGKVGWLQSVLLHKDSPTFDRYLIRNNRYTDLMAKEYQKIQLPKTLSNMLLYTIVKPIWWFVLTFIRHKGFLDGWPGFIFSWYSARRFAVSYRKYVRK